MSKILSIIVPSYNMEAYLPKCLGSLVIDDKELLNRLDVIVVNDGSNDHTSEIAHEFETKYPGVFRVIDKANGHYGSCINSALRFVSGFYVKVLDADDYVSSDNLEKLLRKLSELVDGNYVVDRIVCDYQRVDSKGCIISSVSYDYPTDCVFTIDESLDYDKKYVSLHAVIYRSKPLIENRYFQLEGLPYTDTQWALEPVFYESTTVYIPLVVVKYLVGRDGQSMDPDVFIRSFAKYDFITRYLIGRYNSLNESGRKDGARYYFERLKSLCAYVSHCYIIGVNGKRPITSGRDFDLFLKMKCEEIWRSLADCEASNILHFHYIREWRKHYSTRTLRFAMFFMYMYVAKLCGKIVHIRHKVSG